MTRALLNDLPMNFEAFEAFLADRPDAERWELRDGIADMTPVPVKRHQIVVANLLRLIEAGRGPQADWIGVPGLGVRIPGGAGRAVIPDVVIVRLDEEAGSWTTAPIAAFEVLSPSTRATDLGWKPAAYRDVPSLEHLVIVDPDQVWVQMFDRAAGWRPRVVSALDATLGLAGIGVGIGVAGLYRDVLVRR